MIHEGVIEDAKLIRAMEKSTRSDELAPKMTLVSEARDTDILVVSYDGDLYGYSLTEILTYLLERVDQTDTEIADMRAGMP